MANSGSSSKVISRFLFPNFDNFGDLKHNQPAMLTNPLCSDNSLGLVSVSVSNSISFSNSSTIMKHVVF